MITDALYQSLRAFPQAQRQLKRVLVRLPHRTRVVERFGVRLEVDPSELHGFWLYYEREFDNHLFRRLEGVLSQFDRVFDIGANFGVYTTFFASRGKRVEAYEPLPEMAKALVRNLRLNNLAASVHRVAVGASTGRVAFNIPEKANTGIGHISNDETAFTVPCTTLDNILAGVAGPCLVKIDIEGAEWLALHGGGQRALERTGKTAILMEIHPEPIVSYGGSEGALLELLRSKGYSVTGIREGLDVPPEGCRYWWATCQR